MKNLHTKARILYSSGLITIALLGMNAIGTYKICGSNAYGSCMDMLADGMFVFFPIIPLFLLSLVTYKMSDTVYRAWFSFAKYWIPLSMLIILISPEYATDWMLPIEKGTVASATSALFVVISLVIIGIAYFRSQKR